MSPEALSGGPLARIQTGDMVELDGNNGTLRVLVEDATFNARPNAVPDPEAWENNGHCSGRELFSLFRRNVGNAEDGASPLFRRLSAEQHTLDTHHHAHLTPL